MARGAPVADASTMHVVLAPLRARTWRAVAYLLAELPLSIAAFCVVVAGGLVSLLFAITYIGLPVALATLLVFRALAEAERRLVALELGAPVPAAYRRPGRHGRIRTVLTDPQSWRDLGWLCAQSTLGFGLGCGALVLWATVLAGILTPAWWWALSDDATVGLFDVTSWPRAFAAAGIFLALSIPAAWLTRAAAAGLAWIAETLLRPSGSAVLAERVEHLTATRAGAVDVQASELARIERDLHDGAQARLVAVALELGRAEEKLDADDPEAARALLAEGREQARRALAELRDLVRGIHPSILADRGLGAAVIALAARTPVPVEVEDRVGERPSPAVENAAYFVVSEALVNATKHAGAQRCLVRLARSGGRLVVEVSDDGAGGAEVVPGGGLAGLRSRVEALDGMLAVQSAAGGGTIVRAELPCGS
jgi:signal transduction histidine kinase